MIQLSTDGEMSSGEYGLWLRRWSETIFHSGMRYGSKRTLGLLWGPSPRYLTF